MGKTRLLADQPTHENHHIISMFLSGLFVRSAGNKTKDCGDTTKNRIYCFYFFFCFLINSSNAFFWKPITHLPLLPFLPSLHITGATGIPRRVGCESISTVLKETFLLSRYALTSAHTGHRESEYRTNDFFLTINTPMVLQTI